MSATNASARPRAARPQCDTRLKLLRALGTCSAATGSYGKRTVITVRTEPISHAHDKACCTRLNPGNHSRRRLLDSVACRAASAQTSVDCSFPRWFAVHRPIGSALPLAFGRCPHFSQGCQKDAAAKPEDGRAGSRSSTRICSSPCATSAQGRDRQRLVGRDSPRRRYRDLDQVRPAPKVRPSAGSRGPGQ